MSIFLPSSSYRKPDSSVASVSSDSSSSLSSESESSGSLGSSPSGGSPPPPAPTGGPEGRPSLGVGGGSGSLSDFLGFVTGFLPPAGYSLVSLSCGVSLYLFLPVF